MSIKQLYITGITPIFSQKNARKQPLPQNNQDKNLEKTHYSHLFKRFPPQSSFSYGTITHVQKQSQT